MANVIYSANAYGVRRYTIDTNSTALTLGTACPGKVGSFAIHAVSNTATGNGITPAASQAGEESSVGWINVDYKEDATAVSAGTKITATGRYYIQCDHNEVIRLSFEITGGSWDITVSQGAG